MTLLPAKQSALILLRGRSLCILLVFWLEQDVSGRHTASKNTSLDAFAVRCVTVLGRRALEWHSRGQRFDPAYLHHYLAARRKKSSEIVRFRDFFFLYRDLKVRLFLEGLRPSQPSDHNLTTSDLTPILRIVHIELWTLKVLIGVLSLFCGGTPFFVFRIRLPSGSEGWEAPAVRMLR